MEKAFQGTQNALKYWHMKIHVTETGKSHPINRSGETYSTQMVLAKDVKRTFFIVPFLTEANQASVRKLGDAQFRNIPGLTTLARMVGTLYFLTALF